MTNKFKNDTRIYHSIVDGKDGMEVDADKVLTGEYTGSEKNIIISGIDNIENLVFKGKSVESLILIGVKQIGYESFRNTGLENVKFNDMCQNISDIAFLENNLTTITLPNNSNLEIGFGAFAKNPLTKIINKTGKAYDWEKKLSVGNPTDSVTCEPDGESVTATCTVKYTNQEGEYVETTVNITN